MGIMYVVETGLRRNPYGEKNKKQKKGKETDILEAYFIESIVSFCRYRRTMESEGVKVFAIIVHVCSACYRDR